MPGEYRKRELIDDTLIVTHQIDDSHDGWRTDRFLQTQYKHFSRNQLQNMIDDGRVQIPGKRVKASTTLRPGDMLQVITEGARTTEPAVDLNYKVLYEDDHVLVVDKPGNLPVHPAGKFLFNTLLMALRKERGEWLQPPERDFYVIHRLDRETSGVVLLAKSSPMAGRLVKQFRERQTEKRYLAIVAGHPKQDQFTVDADMGPAIGSVIRLKMAAYPKGQGPLHALTHFKVLQRAARFSLLECELKTGRQHQIRVHLSSVGFPIVADKLYGPREETFLDYLDDRERRLQGLPTSPLKRHALHSKYLRFFHEPLGKWMEIESPLPDDLRSLLS